MSGVSGLGTGAGENNFDDEGYDESQRAEILEATRDGPSDGLILTDLDPDMGDDSEDEDIGDLDMEDGEVGKTDATVTASEDDLDEDDLQDDFDEDGAESDELDDPDDVALRP